MQGGVDTRTRGEVAGKRRFLPKTKLEAPVSDRARRRQPSRTRGGADCKTRWYLVDLAR